LSCGEIWRKVGLTKDSNFWPKFLHKSISWLIFRALLCPLRLNQGQKFPQKIKPSPFPKTHFYPLLDPRNKAKSSTPFVDFQSLIDQQRIRAFVTVGVLETCTFYLPHKLIYRCLSTISFGRLVVVPPSITQPSDLNPPLYCIVFLFSLCCCFLICIWCCCEEEEEEEEEGGARIKFLFICCVHWAFWVGWSGGGLNWSGL
jgi:hypothetical protein